MLHYLIRLPALIGVVFLFFLAGCSSVTPQFSWFQQENLTDSRESEALDLDPDLSPVEADTEICLDQELEALRLTGDWDNQHENQIQQTPVGDMTAPAVSYDFPVTINRQVEVYLDLFQGKQRKYFSRWLARSGRYVPMIQKELAAAGLPLDLVYLSMIESGFNQRAYSRSRAVGLWQFMRPTGRDYNLTINKYMDERRDAIKSTKAAVQYLKDLHDEFDDWYLAVAAYNGGPGRIRSAVRKAQSDDFWKIAQNKSLLLETKRYVPKLIAAIIIAKDPAKYGFADIVYEKPLLFETIDVGPGLSFEAAALLTGSDSKKIKELNIELITAKTPLDREQYELKIPFGTKRLAESNLPRLHSVVSTDYKTHIISKGETLAKICKRYNVNTTTLLKVNNLESNILVAGSRLRIPFRSIHYRILPEGMDASIAASDELILHTIKKGDSISKISKQYQVPAELIVSWNGLSSVHKIRAGQQLALYLSTGSSPAHQNTNTVSKSPTNEIVVLTGNYKKKPADRPSIADYQWYLVKNGDSLWTISRRFKTSPAAIKKWNNLSSNLIHPGSRLKLKDV